MSTDSDLINRVATLERKVAFLLKRMGIDENAVGVVPQDDEIARLVMQGKTIEAIKAYRQKNGVGLAEAKAAIDQLRIQLGR